jgi:hypothetical protein
LTAGDPVTAEQMRALFGYGLHPLADVRHQQLEGPDLTQCCTVLTFSLRRLLLHGRSESASVWRGA